MIVYFTLASTTPSQLTGSVISTGDVYTEYPDPRRDDWVAMILPIFKATPMRELLDKSGLDRRAPANPTRDTAPPR